MDMDMDMDMDARQIVAGDRPRYLTYLPMNGREPRRGNLQRRGREGQQQDDEQAGLMDGQIGDEEQGRNLEMLMS